MITGTFAVGNRIHFIYNDKERTGTVVENSTNWFKLDFGYHDAVGQPIHKNFTKDKIQGATKVISTPQSR